MNTHPIAKCTRCGFEETQLAHCPVCSNNLTIIPALCASSGEWVEELAASMERTAEHEANLPDAGNVEKAWAAGVRWAIKKLRAGAESASTDGSDRSETARKTIQ